MLNPYGNSSESQPSPTTGEIFGIPSRPEKKVRQVPHFDPSVDERRSFARQVVHDHVRPVSPEAQYEQAETLGQISAARIMGERLRAAREEAMQPTILEQDFQQNQQAHVTETDYELAA